MEWREAEGVHAGKLLYRVEDVPRGTSTTKAEAHSKRRSAKEREPPEVRESASLANARQVMKRAADVAPPPQLPAARCAVCGAKARKHCSGCGGASYCGSACQKLHWKEHKPECKAAQAAAADGAAATA